MGLAVVSLLAVTVLRGMRHEPSDAALGEAPLSVVGDPGVEEGAQAEEAPPPPPPEVEAPTAGSAETPMVAPAPRAAEGSTPSTSLASAPPPPEGDVEAPSPVPSPPAAVEAPVPPPLEEDGPVLAQAEVDPPESPPPAVSIPDLQGAWRGSAGRFGLTLTLEPPDGARIAGAMRIDQGPTQRDLKVAGSFNPATGRLRLEEQDGLGFIFEGIVQDGVLSGTWTGGGQKKPAPWELRR